LIGLGLLEEQIAEDLAPAWWKMDVTKKLDQSKAAQP